jgi:hypothetical protein
MIMASNPVPSASESSTVVASKAMGLPLASTPPVMRATAIGR